MLNAKPGALNQILGLRPVTVRVKGSLGFKNSVTSQPAAVALMPEASSAGPASETCDFGVTQFMAALPKACDR